MVKISPISFTSEETGRRRLSDEKREDIRDTAVAGGAAGAGYSAVKGGGFNMAKKLQKASSTSAKVSGELKSGLQTMNNSKKAVNGLANQAHGLFKSFKVNARNIADNMLNSLKSMKAGKFVQRLIDTPIVKGGCKLFGGGLALCVLLSGLGTLYNNTSKVVDNYAPKLADNFNRVVDILDKKSEEA